MRKTVMLFLQIVGAACFGISGYLVGEQSTRLQEASGLTDPKNPGKIVMRSGNDFYVFPGGYEFVPRRLLKQR